MCVQGQRFYTQGRMILDGNTHFISFHTLISLPGSVAIPSFQSSALIMSNSAPWEGQSLGGVSVIPTPQISRICKDNITITQYADTHISLKYPLHSSGSNCRVTVHPLCGLKVINTVRLSPCIVLSTNSAQRPTQFLPALVNSTSQHHH